MKITKILLIVICLHTTMVYADTNKTINLTPHLFQGATNIIFHFRLFHDRPESDENERIIAQAVQTEIVNIIKVINEKIKSPVLYFEGITEENFEATRQAINSVKRAKKALAEYEALPDDDELKQAIEELKKSTNGTDRIVYNTDLLLRQTESQEKFEAAGKVLDNYKVEERNGRLRNITNMFTNPALFDNREDVVLSNIAKDFASGVNTSVTAYVVFGAKHNFLDNIEQWNKTNTMKFNLVVVTPPTLERLYQARK